MSNFTPTTRYLLEFMNTHIYHKLGCFQKTKFSNNSKKLLEIIFENLNVASLSFKKTKMVTHKLTKIPISANFELLDFKIKEHIENMEHIGFSYTFYINSRKIIVNIIYEKDEHVSSAFFKRAIKWIYLWLHIAQSFSHSECSQTLDVFLYLTDLEKMTPDGYDVIDQIHVNTGFTFACKHENEINIYRKEEWFKVLIHECMHSFGLDFSHHECSHINKKILGLFPVNVDVRIYETYCEMWAELLNIMFIVFHGSNSKMENLVKQTEKYMDYERIFSVFQCAKILKHFGLKYKHLYESTQEAVLSRNLRYKENTPVLSYYIIKSFLMYKINHFLEWCVSHNGYSIRFGKTDAELNSNMNDYYELVREHYVDKKYITCIDNLEEWFKRQQKTKRKDDTELKTLRMSLFEII